MSLYGVTATSLNIRSEPKTSASNKIAVLPQGQLVNQVNSDDEPWWFITVELRGQMIEGYVHSRYLLKKENTAIEHTFNNITAVHLQENKTSITRNRDGGRAYPLGEPNRPTRNASDKAGKANQLGEVINWLDAESSSRYQRKGTTTYCNIYAYDYCYLADVYFPRVWWTQRALLELNQGRNVPIQYGQTVRELNANALHDWLEDFGNDFGWQRTFSLNEAQQAANQGRVVIICAKRVTTNRPGHVCPIVPETDNFQAQRRRNDDISRPLQSQAGSRNYKYKAANQWWQATKFQSFGIWLHE